MHKFSALVNSDLEFILLSDMIFFERRLTEVIKNAKPWRYKWWCKSYLRINYTTRAPYFSFFGNSPFDTHLCSILSPDR